MNVSANNIEQENTVDMYNELAITFEIDVIVRKCLKKIALENENIASAIDKIEHN